MSFLGEGLTLEASAIATFYSPIYVINSVDKIKLFCNTPSTKHKVSPGTFPLMNWAVAQGYMTALRQTIPTFCYFKVYLVLIARYMALLISFNLIINFELKHLSQCGFNSGNPALFLSKYVMTASKARILREIQFLMRGLSNCFSSHS